MFMGEYCAKTLFVKGGPDVVEKGFYPCSDDGITISREVKIFEANMGTNGVKNPNTKHHLRDVYLQSNRPLCVEKYTAIELVEIAHRRQGGETDLRNEAHNQVYAVSQDIYA